MTDQLKEVAEICVWLANSTLKNSLSLEELRHRWPLEADKDRLLWRLMHEAEHFLIDEEIRAKDPSYEVYQRDLIMSLLADVLTKYSLLERSERDGKPARES